MVTRLHISLLTVICLGALARPASADQGTTEYMAIYHGQAKVGYTQTTRTLQGKHVRTEVIAAINTGQMSGWKVQMDETVDGKPLLVRRQNLDGSAKIEVVFDRGKMQTKRGDAQAAQVKPMPSGVLLSEGQDLLAKSKGLKDGTSYSFVDLSMAEPQTATISVGPVKEVSVLGKTMKLHEVTCLNGQTRWVEYVDDDYKVQKIVMDLMGLELEMFLCDKKLALGATAPLDLTIQSTLDLPSDISEYRDASAMRIVLVPDGKTKFEIPTTDAQTVSRSQDGSFVVTVRPVQAPVGAAFPYRGDDPEALEALQSSDVCQCQDPLIVEAAREAIGDCSDADRACRKVELTVRALIWNKVTSSDETATAILEHRSGTCRQHAILMVALCRAAGIPARMVVGFAHNGQNQLAGHAWVQCRVGERWVDYDAAQGGFDVAHLALWVGAQKPDYAGLLAEFGHLSVAKVSLELPWYRHLVWPVGLAIGIGALWLILRKAKAKPTA